MTSVEPGPIANGFLFLVNENTFSFFPLLPHFLLLRLLLLLLYCFLSKLRYIMYTYGWLNPNENLHCNTYTADWRFRVNKMIFFLVWKDEEYCSGISIWL